MASKASLRSSSLRWSGGDVDLHVGGGNYVSLTKGDPVPDGFEPSNFGPDWVSVPDDEASASVAASDSKEV